MSGHKDRAHALLSASSAHRWMTCTPSAVLESQFPDTTSEAAAEGTLAHELAESKLWNYLDPNLVSKRSLSGRISRMKKNPLWQDEMTGHTDTYVEEIRKIQLSYRSRPYVIVESRLDLNDWVPEGFGTADCILIGDGIMHVVDFKYGKGVPVHAAHNPQLQLYALGALGRYGMLYDIDTVRMTIIQPRLDNIDTWEIPVTELLAFGSYVQDRAKLAITGAGDFLPSEEACRFCRARQQCRARAEANASLAFGNDPPIGKKPPLISNEEVGEYLRIGEDVARWLADLKEYALSECLAGRDVAGWKAVEGRGSREWTDMEAAFGKLVDSGISETLLYERKPLTLAAVEKLVGKKDFAAQVGEYVEKKPGKPALVPESDKREAITNRPTAAEAFGTPS